MKIDPSFCIHSNIKKSVKTDTLSVPELGLEQLVLQVRVFCGDCKSSFVFKSVPEGFSTNHAAVVGDTLIIPLELPPSEDLSDTEAIPGHSDLSLDIRRQSSRDNLH